MKNEKMFDIIDKINDDFIKSAGEELAHHREVSNSEFFQVAMKKTSFRRQIAAVIVSTFAVLGGTVALAFGIGRIDDTPADFDKNQSDNTTDTEGNYISDPFSSSEESTDNPVRDNAIIFSAGGFQCEINNGNKIALDKEEITVPVKVTASEKCKADISVGLMCCINGKIQQLSLDTQKDLTMVIKENIAPEQTVEFEVSFKPVLSEYDKDKNELPVQFFAVFNPTYKASEEFLSFGNTHDIGMTFVGSAEIISSCDSALDNAYCVYEEGSAVAENSTNGYFDGKNQLSAIGAESGKKSGFTLWFDNYDSGEYIGYVLKNNKVATFNGGYDSINVTVKPAHSYKINIKPDSLEAGDVIQCFFVKKDSLKINSVIAFSAILVTENEVKDNISDEQNTENSLPEPPVSSDIVDSSSEISEDSSDNLQSAEDSGTSQDNNDSNFNIFNEPTKNAGNLNERQAQYYLPLGNLSENVSVIMFDEKIAVCNIDTGEILYEMSISERTEIENGFIEAYWSNAKVINGKIAVPKLVVKDNTAVFEGMSVFNSELKFCDDIPIISDIITFDGENSIKVLYDNYPESDVQSIYICKTTDNDIKSRKLCDMPSGYQIITPILKTDENYLYGIVKDSPDSKKAYAFAVDLNSGKLIINKNKYTYSANGRIYPAKSYTLFAVGERNPKSSDGGVIVYFDKKNGEFKEISTLSINEGLYAAITPDGSKIVASASVFTSIDKPNDDSIRVYDTGSGQLISSTKIEGFSFPVCSNDGFFAVNGEKLQKFTFKEMR